MTLTCVPSVPVACPCVVKRAWSFMACVLVWIYSCLQAAASYHAGSVRQQLIQQAFAPVDSFGGLPVHNVTDVRLHT